MIDSHTHLFICEKPTAELLEAAAAAGVDRMLNVGLDETTNAQVIAQAEANDPVFAKNQLLLLLREWYLHPNGQMPAYEFAFGDVNPPVHAWAVIQVYLIDGRRNGGIKDIDFLERAFQKLLLNFTWWVNRNDEAGHNLFGGGFLGLDNIGVFDRSVKMPGGTRLDQADGTAWMGLYCSAMLLIALELAQTRPPYEDIASKFFEHYIAIIDAINNLATNNGTFTGWSLARGSG